MEREVPLLGGNVSTGVVRVGATVRRPSTPASPAVHAFLVHLEHAGCSSSPRGLGFDEHGRHVVEFAHGSVLMPFEPQDPLIALRRVGRLLRELHDASASFVPPRDPQWNVVIPPDATDLVVHHDAAPWNLIVGERRWVFIDWDNAGPGSRLWDLAYAAHGFVPLAPGPPDQTGSRLAALVTGYGLDERGRQDLVDLLVPRILSMHTLLQQGSRKGVQPWSRLWEHGHGDVWLSHTDDTTQHLSILREAVLDAP